jgi:glutathione synthase/RimK-type ligase-like ATP-grasp enzyme
LQGCDCRKAAIRRTSAAMSSPQRVFVNAVRRYGERHAITIDVRSDGWLIVMQKAARRHLVFGYDVGLNSAVARGIANDKAACAEILAHSGIACVSHTLFLNPRLNAHTAPDGSWRAMLDLLVQHPRGIVVKPNEGTSGRSVFLVSCRPQLELAVQDIFTAHTSLAIAPYLAIEDEVRVVVLDQAPLVVYGKNRPAIEGDGTQTLLELAIAATPPAQRSAVLPDLLRGRAKSELDTIVPAGQRRVLNWRHNLDAGAHPVLIEQGDARATCVRLAVKAAHAIGLRFGSIDIVRAGGRWQILEINAGVMMEQLAGIHPDLVDAAYAAALDKVFELDARPPPRPGEGRDP